MTSMENKDQKKGAKGFPVTPPRVASRLKGVVKNKGIKPVRKPKKS